MYVLFVCTYFVVCVCVFCVDQFEHKILLVSIPPSLVQLKDIDNCVENLNANSMEDLYVLLREILRMGYTLPQISK